DEGERLECVWPSTERIGGQKLSHPSVLKAQPSVALRIERAVRDGFLCHVSMVIGEGGRNDRCWLDNDNHSRRPCRLDRRKDHEGRYGPFGEYCRRYSWRSHTQRYPRPARRHPARRLALAVHHRHHRRLLADLDLSNDSWADLIEAIR